MYFVFLSALVSGSVLGGLLFGSVSLERGTLLGFGTGTGCGCDDDEEEGSRCEGCATLPSLSGKRRRWSSSLLPEGEKITMTTMFACEGFDGLVLLSLSISSAVVPVEAWSWHVRNALSRSAGKDSITPVP